MFEFLKLKRDPKRVSKSLSFKSGKYIANENVKILMPKRYLNVGFMTIDTSVKALGVFIIITDDYKYSLSAIPVKVELVPEKLDTIDIVGKDYYLLSFSKGSTVIENTKLIKTPDFVFGLIDEFIIKGNAPFFMEYEDIPDIFVNARKYTGSNVADDISSITLLTSLIARHHDNKFFRTDISKPMKLIALNDPINRYHDTFSKLASNYLKKGVLSAIINPETESTIHTEVYKR